MMMWLLILGVSALILGDFRSIKGSTIASYSPEEISLSETTIQLKDESFVRISGLSYNEFIFCFREDRMIFPNNTLDQEHEHELPVYEGDEIIWFEFVAQPPQPFFDALLSRTEMTWSQLLGFESEVHAAYKFRVVKEQSVSSLLANHVCSWGSVKCALIVVFTNTLLFLILIPLLLNLDNKV